MEAGLADHVWSLEELVGLLDSQALALRPDMSPAALIIIAIVVLLPLLTIFRFVLFSRWIDHLNTGLPPDQHFQLIRWWTPGENLRAWRRWREIRKARKGT